MAASLKQQTLAGIIWNSIERFSVQGIQFVILVLMARILTPDDYGIVGMLAIFTAIAQSLVDSGFSNALIQKIDRTETDYATVFYFNIAVGFFLYFALYASAPAIARFYEMPLLIKVARVLGLTFFFNSLAVVPRAILMIRLDFKTQAKASIASTVVSGTAGVWAAYSAWGVWAIVLYMVLNVFLNTSLLWLLLGWRPKRVFSGASFRRLFSFGSKLMVSGLVDTVYKNIYTLVIGKKFSATELGYFTRADQFAQFPAASLTGIVLRVTFPVLSELQNEDERLKFIYRKFLRLSAFVVFPLMIGVAVLARPLIVTMLNPMWLPAAILFQILCFSYMWYPVHAINLNLLQIKGYSNLFLRLELIKKAIGVLILCVTIPLGVKAMCLGSVVSALLGLVINTYYTGRLISVGLFKQLHDLLPTLCYTAVMGLVVWGVTQCVATDLMKLVTGTLCGMITYTMTAFFTGSADLKELWTLIRQK